MGKTRDLHNSAMLHFQNGIILEYDDKLEESLVEYKKAFQFEKQSANSLQTNNITRKTKNNVLLRSSESLAFKIGNIKECISLLNECENNKPKTIIQMQIEQLREHIHERS